MTTRSRDIPALTKQMREYAIANPWKPGNPLKCYRRKDGDLEITFYFSERDSKFVLELAHPWGVIAGEEKFFLKAFDAKDDFTQSEPVREDGQCVVFKWSAYSQPQLFNLRSNNATRIPRKTRRAS